MVGIKKPAQDSGELSNRIQLVRDLFDLSEEEIDAAQQRSQDS